MGIFHRHKWKAIDTTPMEVRRPIKVVNGLTVPLEWSISLETVILYECSCGLHKTERLEGTWQINSKEDDELGMLRKMAGIK